MFSKLPFGFLVGQPSTIENVFMKTHLAVATTLVVLAGCGAQKYDVDSSLQYLELMGSPMVQIALTSLENEVIVNSVSINRGQCRDVDRGRNFPFTLKYGENMTVLSERCKVREVAWTINGIEHTFNWDPH